MKGTSGVEIQYFLMLNVSRGTNPANKLLLAVTQPADLRIGERRGWPIPEVLNHAMCDRDVAYCKEDLEHELVALEEPFEILLLREKPAVRW